MGDPLLGDDQPTDAEYAAARRAARQQAAWVSASQVVLGVVLALVWEPDAWVPFVLFAPWVWLFVPIWTRHRLSHGRGKGPGRVY